MKVQHIPCGPYANESEEKAVEHLKSRLQSAEGNGEWVLLSNLAFSVNHQVQSDEIDMVAIGPPGVKVIEVKHWGPQWVNENSHAIEVEADRATSKARKIGTTLRKNVHGLPHVEAAFLLTRAPSEIRSVCAKKVRGVALFTLNDWEGLLGFGEPARLTSNEIHRLTHLLEPRTAINLEGTLRRFAGLVNLELRSPREERFHRVYEGVRPVQQDKVVLHLYDLSASGEKNAETLAKREFDALHALQRYDWAPRILDSFHEAPGYPGEMFYFTLVDPAAPTLEERKTDVSWGVTDRASFAQDAARALGELHVAREEGAGITHRNLTPKTIRVRHDGRPIFTGFHLARIPTDTSIADVAAVSTDWASTAAPEASKGGLAATDQRSDVYSLCASLRLVFENQPDDTAKDALRILRQGLAERPEDRVGLDALAQSFAELRGESVPSHPPPAARFWSEEQIVPFHDHDYRIVSRLGSGGVGHTFKVIEVDRHTKEDLGTFVAKVAHDKDRGERVLNAYNLARSHLGRHSGLSAIYEVAKEWRDNNFVALMTWIEGAPLADFAGVFPLLAEDLQEESAEALALRWLRDLSDALDTLHKNGLIHGDVSPRNIILSGADVVLTDYDFVSKIGEPLQSPGTVLYCSPSFQEERAVSPSDDLYALAASFFHVLFDQEPFQYEGARAKERGLNWEGVNREEYPRLCEFLDKATKPDAAQRFESAREAMAALHTPGAIHPDERESDQEQPSDVPEPAVFKDEEVGWLFSLLQSYPGSRWGNQETRGLDTPFAAQTYVDTGLEESLINAIRERRTRLIVLCGNAGDGKTALLQRIAARLGFGEHKSAERVLTRRMGDGLTVRMNFDGSAAWRGRSADEILDEFLRLFLHRPPAADVAHLLAINDGRLLEWIEGLEGRLNGMTPLTEALTSLLEEEGATSPSYLRFISLNQRSLVGGITSDQKRIEVGFLEKLLDRLYGGEEADRIWKPCLSCSANRRCEVFRALTVFGPDKSPAKAPNEIRSRARQRLFEALQAVHLRGEVHITARELRAALVFILFGLHSCKDYHQGVEPAPLPYWDLAFDPTTPGRQGEVLRELVYSDPALEAHPQIDRHLLSELGLESGTAAPRYGPPLTSARRRALFEWTEENVAEIAGDKEAVGLARGRHLSLFRQIALTGDEDNVKTRTELCKELCRGMSRLEDLPPQALDRPGVVPLRITPRTPTETAFWVEKRLDAFRLEADLPPVTEGVDRLHRQAWLIYRYRDGREERLRVGAELFHLLLELSEGYQLGDVSSDDAFAHLSIFVQRLAQEDERELLAWNPMRDESIYRIAVQRGPRGAEVSQKLVLRPVNEGGGT